MEDPWGIRGLEGGEGLEGANRKKKKSAENFQKSEEKKFWLEMVWKTLETPRNPLKIWKTNRKNLKLAKSGKN